MAQDFELPTTADSLSTAQGTKIPNSLSALRSSFSGTAEPGSSIRVGGMLWADDTNDELKLRNLADGSWLYPMRRIEKVDERAWSAAAFTCFLMCPIEAARLEKVRIVSTTATTGSSAGVTEYVIDVYNVTAAASMLGATVSTGDGEIAANTAFDVEAELNNALTAGDVAEFRVTVNGTPTSLTRVAVYAFWIPNIG